MNRFVVAIFGGLVVIASAYFLTRHHLTVVDSKAFVADGKVELFKDPDFQKLSDTQGVHLTYESKKTDEIVNNSTGADLAILGSSFAVTKLEKKLGHPLKSEPVFQSIVVLLTWDNVADAFLKKGWVTNIAGILYLNNLKDAFEADINNVPWSQLGLEEFYGPVKWEATDPRLSSSGMLVAGLMGQVFIGENGALNETSIAPFLPQIGTFFRNIGGGIKGSTGDLFKAFLWNPKATHPGAFVYESQIIEFAEANKDDIWAKNKDKVRILYPVPTVWSTQYAVALTPNGERMISVLSSPESRKLAWEKHGLRYGVAGGLPSKVDPKLGFQVPSEINKIARTPSDATYDVIRASLGK